MPGFRRPNQVSVGQPLARTARRYLEYLDDDEWVVAFTESLMEHPLYQTTPEEDCAILILMAAVMSGDYTLPPDSDVDRLCAWYRRQVGGE